MAFSHSRVFLLMVRLEQSNATRTSVAGEVSTEPLLYLRLSAQMQTSLATLAQKISFIVGEKFHCQKE